MALTTNGIVPQPDPRATSAAAAVYGQPADATRMNREAGTAAVADAYTSTPTGESSYADGSFNLGSAKRTTGKTAGAAINNAGTGFPGLSNEPSRG